MSWGHVWARVLGWGPLLQLTLVVGGPPGLGRTAQAWQVWSWAQDIYVASSHPCQHFPRSVRGRPECCSGCCCHLRIQNVFPVSSCLLAHFPVQGVLEGLRRQFPPWLLFWLHMLLRPLTPAPTPSPGSLPFLWLLSSGSSPEPAGITSLSVFDQLLLLKHVLWAGDVGPEFQMGKWKPDQDCRCGRGEPGLCTVSRARRLTPLPSLHWLLLPGPSCTHAQCQPEGPLVRAGTLASGTLPLSPTQP